MTPELLKAHAAKRAEEYVSEAYRDHQNRDYDSVEMEEAHSAGHQEGLELGKLIGEAKAYRLSGMEGAAEEAETLLERLLSPDSGEET